MQVTVVDIKKCLEKAVPAGIMDTMDPSKPMVSQGVDSLAMTIMAVALQNTYKVKISPEDGLTLKTLDDIAAFINRSQG